MGCSATRIGTFTTSLSVLMPLILLYVQWVVPDHPTNSAPHIYMSLRTLSAQGQY